MMNLRTLALGALTFGLGLSLTACSNLTRPDEITIVAEPLPQANAPVKAPELRAPEARADENAQPGRRAPLRQVENAAQGCGVH